MFARSYEGFARRTPKGALLRLGPQPLSVVWTNPFLGIHSAGLGVTGEGGGEVRWLSTPPQSLPGPWFGGWAFDATRLWEGFPAEYWMLPEVLSWHDGRGGGAWRAAFGPQGTGLDALQRRLDAVEETQQLRVAVGQAQRSDGEQHSWHALVENALSVITRGHCDKIVCARVLRITADLPFSERAALEALAAQHTQCYSFLVRGRNGRAFLGASPELLCEASSDGVLCVDALAGTIVGQQTDALLRCEKKRLEHALVVDEIQHLLTPYALHIHKPPTPRTRSLGYATHLHTPFRAQLKPHVSALRVARALHPTAAVAGLPRTAALAFLNKHEGFQRGWYAGVVGAAGETSVTLAVALRSALLDGQQAHVFTGAGIVAGSHPAEEWLETECKAIPMLQALGVPPVVSQRACV